jgi:hypothetical protein
MARPWFRPLFRGNPLAESISTKVAALERELDRLRGASHNPKDVEQISNLQLDVKARDFRIKQLEKENADLRLGRSMRDADVCNRNEQIKERDARILKLEASNSALVDRTRTLKAAAFGSLYGSGPNLQRRSNPPTIIGRSKLAQILGNLPLAAHEVDRYAPLPTSFTVLVDNEALVYAAPEERINLKDVAVRTVRLPMETVRLPAYYQDASGVRIGDFLVVDDETARKL